MQYLRVKEIRVLFNLAIRFLLAYVFISYGISKLANTQFGVSQDDLSINLGEISLFKLAWHLFDHQPFKSFIGISEIICGLLLIYNRTRIIGTFMCLVLCFNILIIDLTIMPASLADAFLFRFSFYIILCIYVLYTDIELIKNVLRLIFSDYNSLRIPLRRYLVIPILSIGIAMVGFCMKFILNLVLFPYQTIEGLIHFYRTTISPWINLII